MRRAGPRLVAGSFPLTSMLSAAVTAPVYSLARKVTVCGRARARAPRVRQCRTTPPATPVVLERHVTEPDPSVPSSSNQSYFGYAKFISFR